jgi:hypothetical protein
MKWLSQSVLVVSVLALGFAACTKSQPKNSTPEEALKSYVETAFNLKEFKDAGKLLDLSTGEAYDWLYSMNQDAFTKQFLGNHMMLRSFSTKDKITDDKGDVSLVYEIAFQENAPSGTPKDETVFTNKKIAYLTKDKDSGNWKIRATKNVKTFLERKDPLEILSPEPAPQAEAKPEDNKPKGK